MNTINNTVIVWGMDNSNTLGIIRELGKNGIDSVFLIRGHAKYAAHSKYCKQYIESKTTEDGYAYLMEHFSESKYKPIIVTPGDNIMTFIDGNRHEMEKLFILPGSPTLGQITKYIDKNHMNSLAEKVGITCPKSQPLKWDSDISNIKYPCFVKPSHEKPGHYNEFKFRICKNPKQLTRILKMVRHDSEFIVQEYIKSEYEIVVYGARMLDGETEIAGALIRDRLSDSGFSSHGLVTDEIPDCVDVAKIINFVESVDYYGPFGVEYGVKGENAYFFEINLRNDATSTAFFQCGANILTAYILSCAGVDHKEVSTIVTRKEWFIDDIFDLENVLSLKITKKKWKSDMDTAKVYKYYDPDDLEPWEIACSSKRKQILQDLILHRIRLLIVYFLDKMGLRK